MYVRGEHGYCVWEVRCRNATYFGKYTAIKTGANQSSSNTKHEYKMIMWQHTRSTIQTQKQTHHNKNNNRTNEIIPMHSMVRNDFTWDGKVKMVAFDVSIRAILGAFMIGTGGHGVGKLLMLGRIPGSSSFERGFYRHWQYVHNRIIRRCKRIIDRSLRDEICATVIKTWDGAKPQHLQTKALRLVDDAKYDDLEELIGPTPLSVSYDMGWQRRGGGRVFDSLSGHGYLMGCLNGKVIHASVLKNRCSTCMNHNGYVEQLPKHKYNVNHSGNSG